MSTDFAQVVSRSQVPVPIIRRLASFAEDALKAKAFSRERELFRRPPPKQEVSRVYPVISPRARAVALVQPTTVSEVKSKKRSRGAKALLESLEIEAQCSGIEGYGAEILKQLRQR